MNMNFTASMTHGLSFDSYKETVIYESCIQPKSGLDIVTEICHKLDNEALKDALFIVDNIRENRMKIKWSSGNIWSVQYKRKHVCDLKIERDSLIIGPVNDVLITRVKNMSHNQVSIEHFIDALRKSMNGAEKSFAFNGT